MSSSNSNIQRNLVKVLNAVALLMVVGCVFYLSSSNERTTISVEDRLAKFGLVEEDITIPTTNNNKKTRKLGKGKGSSYYDDYYDSDCVPLYPTPAPTKGKGKGSNIRQLSEQERKLGKGKGKGSGSAAPSFYCSNAPSSYPSVSNFPSSSIAPSGAPSISNAPSCYSKGKGKGSSLFVDEECGKGKGKGSRA